MPAISSKNKKASANVAFKSQVGRETYHRAFLKKQEEHKVPLGSYKANYNLTEKRPLIASIDSGSTSDGGSMRTLAKSYTVRSLSPTVN